MRITTNSGTLILDANDSPSADDQNDIISSLTRNDDNGAQFQALCDASTKFPAVLTNGEFFALCEEWLKKN